MPALASSATRYPSSVPTYTVLSRLATPRFTRGNPRFRTLAAIGRVHSQSGLPLFTSSAYTEVGPEVPYSTPFAKSGVVSSEPVPVGWYAQTGRRCATFCAVICASGENRCDEYEPEYIGHSPSCAKTCAIPSTAMIAPHTIPSCLG